MCLAIFAAAGAALAAPPADVVRNDWYLRESLGTIRDWDAMVARVYPQKEKAPQPVFPVPADGKTGAWPNPVPFRLWPTADMPPRITVRVAGGAMQIERTGPDGKRGSQAVPAAELIVVRVAVESEVYWIPLFTYAEDVAGVLAGIEQAFADVPDAAAAKRLDELNREAVAWEPDGAGRNPAAWRSLFEQASTLRDQMLLARIPFDRLLLVKRKPFVSDQPYMDAHHKGNPPGGGIYVLSPVRPDGKVSPVVDALGEGIYRDVCLHWEGDRLLFAFGNGQDPCKFQQPPSGSAKQSYHVYEVRTDGSALRQLTTGPKNDCEPFYLPGGQIGFTSDRSDHYVMCGGNIHAPTLYLADGDGGNVRRLSFNVFNDFSPCVMPDGRILYSRWEYNERSVTSIHNPFTMHPHGSMVATYFGNATIVPNVYMYPRPVPGSDKIMALFTSHHGQTYGAVGLIDVRQGVDGRQAIGVLTPEVPITGERVGDSWRGWYNTPQPLSETTWLCSFTPTARPTSRCRRIATSTSRPSTLIAVRSSGCGAWSAFGPVKRGVASGATSRPTGSSDTSGKISTGGIGG
jgi:hypothetical protein